ncbi:Por secretion system C-terminal sorting domain-containing protein [Chitinophaga costaii]|uniref:Por secretion system C-terminal sorting domain-containing protein n=1 Tax=Chitinophaga costaii TaxID=1335309 RepID=A0A1C4C358_9BACT|nr:S8/S53 family peptidase [Chitinophaga costaii]PUZ27354.1 T9SS C-terminal target domain-containing protein [Chitinophaga costaii]SCC13531.1 Por secretion system C-terminal sorting domain-containing protein [Chitinophaga costaii]
MIHSNTVYRLLLVLLLLLPLASLAQAPRYVITFTDKNNSPYRLTTPAAYLSPRALARRQRMHIVPDSSDLPVNPAYLTTLLATGQVTLRYTSRWFNQAIIQTTDSEALQKINALPFVKNTSAPMQRQRMDTAHNVYKWDTERKLAATKTTLQANANDYGYAYTQIHLHNGEYLHQKGYTGQGMLIAVLDAGFPGVNTNPGYDSLRAANGIVYTFNCSTALEDVYGDDVHGAWCFSTLAANLPGQLVGTAPGAQYALFKTEEAATEQPIEENNWAAAAERADSLGADILSSSLAYNTFDNATYNYTYAQMDGHTSLIAKAAIMAARKGMIVLNAIGNEGSNTWHYSCTPADADSILAVGAVNGNKIPAAFSSYGPAADGRIKPDVAAMGVSTQLLDTNGTITASSGTSFATPVLAGLVTCLWQAFPQIDNIRLMQVVRACSDHYTAPDNRVGYGIPDFKMAFDTLTKIVATDSTLLAERLDHHLLRVLPNPFSTAVKIYYASTGKAPVQITLYNALGRLVRLSTTDAPANGIGVLLWNNLSNLAPGLYFMRYVQGTAKASTKLLKL